MERLSLEEKELHTKWREEFKQQSKEKKMEDNKFWLKFWTRIGVVFSVFVITCSTCTIHSNTLIDKEIMSGKDPIAVKCAFGGYSSQSLDQLICSKK